MLRNGCASADAGLSGAASAYWVGRGRHVVGRVGGVGSYTQGVLFFGKHVALSDEDDGWAADKLAYAQYTEHLARLSLPDSVREIADAYFPDDALIARLRQSDNPAKLELTLRCGWHGPGYFDLYLNYEAPEIGDDDLLTLLTVAENAKACTRYGMTDVWCHEFDVLPDGRLMHSIAFHWPGGMRGTSVTCAGLEVERIPRESRELPPFRDRYRVGRFGASSVDRP